MTEPLFRFDNSYARELEGLYVAWNGAPAPAPRMLKFNKDLARALGLDAVRLAGDEGAQIFSGSVAPEGASPLAQAYAGHQFGGFSPQLGDGRALLLGEILDPDGRRFDLHLKGSGQTPFSRGGDGKAAVGPVLREYVIGEAMHALGIPTTRALAAVATGAPVLRDRVLPGAVLARVASSHIRVGTFQFFAARGDVVRLTKLAAHTIARHDPGLAPDGKVTPEAALGLLDRVVRRQAFLVAQWMLVGFIHGVMNTDNMTISGETIDYGPCAFMEGYDLRTVFSSIDTHGRYAYGNQPAIAQWNLARLAEALLPLMGDDEDAAIEKAGACVNGYAEHFQTAWINGARAKLGLASSEEGDDALVKSLLAAMSTPQGALGQHAADFTGTFRALCRFEAEGEAALAPFFGRTERITDFAQAYTARLARDSMAPAQRRAAMEAVNPIYIPRNHKVEEALAAATEGDLEPFDKLVEVISRPFTERPGLEPYAEPAPSTFGPYRTFCGT
ncbi:YdiU family protein [Pannonibacter indicus]|uniref:protein adenylyltransferase SelO n=1 Tax=Pannonibacter indicus TaxID=466044 RepID=UPI0035B4838C